MKSISLFLFFSLFTLALTGCLGSDDGNSDAPSEVGVEIPDISLACSSSVSGCEAGSNGDVAYLVWTADTCDGFTGSQIYAINGNPAACDAGGCTAANVGPWLDVETDEPVTVIPQSATTAAIWFDTADNAGDDSEPETGDVFCCVGNQSDDVTLEDADCQTVP